MKTNQNPAQEQPAQPQAPETDRSEPLTATAPKQPAGQSPPEPLTATVPKRPAGQSPPEPLTATVSKQPAGQSPPEPLTATVPKQPAGQPSPEPLTAITPEQPNRQFPPGQQPRQAAPTPQAAKRLYNPDEAAQIVRPLTDGYFAPEYILLFGKLVGGTYHSDAAAYDLLLVVRETPEYDWMQAKRILRYKIPVRQREITYINLYIIPLSYVESRPTPFLYFAHSEGELLYCSDHYRFRRPKHPIDFAAAYADARFHFDTFRLLGNELIEQAQNAFSESRNMRLAALFSAQAAVYFYHTLYYVYHGLEFDSHDPVVMHERMRTLSTKLMLLFDDNRIESIFTLPCLKKVLFKTHYDIDFVIPPQELEIHMGRVGKLGDSIERYCELRLELYKELSER